jgi:hypothetical protein
VKRFQVWIEGSRRPDSDATFLGTYEAKDFEDAVREAAFSRGYTLDYVGSRLSWDHRRFFDNDADARKSYG